MNRSRCILSFSELILGDVADISYREFVSRKSSRNKRRSSKELAKRVAKKEDSSSLSNVQDPALALSTNSQGPEFPDSEIHSRVSRSPEGSSAKSLQPDVATHGTDVVDQAALGESARGATLGPVLSPPRTKAVAHAGLTQDSPNQGPEAQGRQGPTQEQRARIDPSTASVPEGRATTETDSEHAAASARPAASGPIESYRWQERAALFSLPFSVLAIGIALTSAYYDRKESQRQDSQLLSSVVADAETLDTSKVERLIELFSVQNRAALEQLALAESPDVHAANIVGRRLQKSIPHDDDLRGRCRAIIAKLNVALEATQNEAAYEPLRTPFVQAFRSVVHSDLIPCLVLNEENASRLGLFIARFYFGSTKQADPLKVLKFDESYPFLRELSSQQKVALPSHYQGETPSGDLNLERVEFPPCGGSTIIPLTKSGHFPTDWTLTGTFVRGDFHHRVAVYGSCESECTCARISSRDGRDILEMGIQRGDRAFARIGTRFAESFRIEVPARPENNYYDFRLVWDFQRMESEDAVALTVNGNQGSDSPEASAEPF